MHIIKFTVKIKSLRKKINDDISLKVQWRGNLEMDVNYTARKDNI